MSLLRSAIKHLHERYLAASFEREDRVVRSVFENDRSTQLTVLEAGSGLGRFAQDLQMRFPNLRLTCVEINPALVESTRALGLNVVQGDVRHLPFAKESFDVIHCSHVIEHLAYPDVTDALDAFMRLLKPNGRLIIRTPLLSPTFYNDIDHIRPYPPQSILNYFHNQQQQKQGCGRIEVERLWYRTPPVHVHFPRLERLSIHLNTLFRGLWTIFPHIHGRADGYVLIFKKHLPT